MIFRKSWREKLHWDECSAHGMKEALGVMEGLCLRYNPSTLLIRNLLHRFCLPLSLYWDIGRMIVERQKGKTWGKAVMDKLA